MSKQTISGDQARAALLRGVDAVANPVKVTLGPRGRNVLLDRPGQPLATRDGVTVAKEVSDLPDHFENMGAAYAREVADAAVTEAGDGTTTASVLLQAIVSRGLKLVSQNAEPLLLADGIHQAAEACADSIRELAIPATPEIVRQVAVIATHGDKELGELIACATLKVGKRGVVELTESRTHETSVEYLEGFYFERGWRGPRGEGQNFVTDLSAQRCVLENPLILLSERIIVGGQRGVTGDHIFNILQACVCLRRPLLVIAEDLQGDALNLLTTQVGGGTIPGACFVKLPGFGDSRTAALRDLQVAIGAGRIHSLASTRLDDQLSSFVPARPRQGGSPPKAHEVVADSADLIYDLSALGQCERAIISPTRTVLINGNFDPVQMVERERQLIQQSTDAGDDYDKAQINLRLARLMGGVAVLSVGAQSEPAMLEKKARAEDAVYACRGAMEAGVVPGGGVALLRAGIENTVLGSKPWRAYGYRWPLFLLQGHTSRDFSTDSAKGAQILLDAIREPALQIIRNTGRTDAEKVVEKIERMTGAQGYNAATGTYADLYAAGVVDPAKVTLVALLKAASIGALLLTTEVLVADLPAPATMPTSNIPVIYRA